MFEFIKEFYDWAKQLLLHAVKILQGVSKKCGPFLKLVQFLYLSRNLSKILYGHSKMIILCSGEDSIYRAVLQQEVTS